MRWPFSNKARLAARAEEVRLRAEEERQGWEAQRQAILSPPDYPMEDIAAAMMNRHVGIVVRLLYTKIYHLDRRVKDLENLLKQEETHGK